MMKYILTLMIATSVVSFLFVPTPSYGIDLGKDIIKQAGEKAGYDKYTDETTLAKNIGTAVNMVLSITGVIFTTLMVYAGYLWMTAQGKDEQIEKAKKILTTSIIGLVITLGAFSISAFIVPRILAASTV